MKFQRLFCAVAIAPMFFVMKGYSQEGSLDAHVHGISELTVAIGGSEVELHFDSPSMNIVGFEYVAKSDEDRSSAERAVEILSQPNDVISISGGGCQLSEVIVDASGVLPDGVRREDEHGHEDEHEHDDEAHSEIHVDYHYECKNIETVSAIQIDLFQAFPGIELIKVMWVKEDKQGGMTLTSDKNSIRFR